MYSKKAKKQIRDYLKNEEDPIKGLLPKKANIDLKRNLETKLEKLSLITERSLLDLLSKFQSYRIYTLLESQVEATNSNSSS